MAEGATSNLDAVRAGIYSSRKNGIVAILRADHLSAQRGREHACFQQAGLQGTGKGWRLLPRGA